MKSHAAELRSPGDAAAPATRGHLRIEDDALLQGRSRFADVTVLLAHWYSQANGTGENLDDPAVQCIDAPHDTQRQLGIHARVRCESTQ